MNSSLPCRFRIGLKSIALTALMTFALASSPLLAQGRLLVQSEDGVSVVHAGRNNEPAIIEMGTVRVGFARILGLGYSNAGAGLITNIVVGELTGDNPEAFAITRDECTGATLAPGALCLIELRFEPPDMAAYSADFEVTSTAVNSPDRFRLIGSGIFDELFSDRFQ